MSIRFHKIKPKVKVRGVADMFILKREALPVSSNMSFQKTARATDGQKLAKAIEMQKMNTKFNMNNEVLNGTELNVFNQNESVENELKRKNSLYPQSIHKKAKFNRSDMDIFNSTFFN